MKKIIKKSRALLIILTFLLVLTPITALAETREKEEINYVSLGDSLAAGLLFNRELSAGYVGNIVEELESRGYHVNVFNKGVPGATSADVLASLLEAPELAEADIVTLSAGANDILGELDLLKIGKFDPIYLDPEAVLLIKSAAEAGAFHSMVSAAETADESIAEASENIMEMITPYLEIISIMELLEEPLSEDLMTVFYEMMNNLALAATAMEAAKEVAVNDSESIDVETIQPKTDQIELASIHLDKVIENINNIKSALEFLLEASPDMTGIIDSLETIKTLTSTAKLNLDTAKEALNVALSTSEEYNKRLIEIASLVENAVEVSQMMASIPDEIEAIGQRVGQIVMAIKQVNPDAKVYVLGYYNALPYLAEALQEQLTIPLLVGLNLATQTATTATGTVFIPTFDLFTGKHLSYLPNPADIHPSEVGYQAIAEAFMNRISESFPELEVIPPVTEDEDETETSPVTEDEDENETEIPPVTEDEDDNEAEVPPVIDEEDMLSENEVETANEDTSENRLPNTATNQYHWLLVGVLLLLLGSSFLWIQHRKNQMSR